MTLASLGMTGHEEPEIWNFNADNHIETGVHIKVVGIVSCAQSYGKWKIIVFFTHPLDACLKTMPWQGMKGRKDSQSWSPSSKLVHRFTSPISKPPPEETDHLFNIYVSSLQLAAGRPLQWIQETAPTAMRQIKIKHLASDLPEDHPD